MVGLSYSSQRHKEALRKYFRVTPLGSGVNGVWQSNYAVGRICISALHHALTKLTKDTAASGNSASIPLPSGRIFGRAGHASFLALQSLHSTLLRRLSHKVLGYGNRRPAGCRNRHRVGCPKTRRWEWPKRVGEPGQRTACEAPTP